MRLTLTDLSMAAHEAGWLSRGSAGGSTAQAAGVVTADMAVLRSVARAAETPSAALPGFCVVEEHLARAVVTLMDVSISMGYDLEGSVIAEIERRKQGGGCDQRHDVASLVQVEDGGE